LKNDGIHQQPELVDIVEIGHQVSSGKIIDNFVLFL